MLPGQVYLYIHTGSGKSTRSVLRFNYVQRTPKGIKRNAKQPLDRESGAKAKAEDTKKGGHVNHANQRAIM